MSLALANTGGPIGLQFKNEDVLAINRTGSDIVPGELVQFDLVASDGDVNDNDQGAEDSGLSNVIAPAAATPGRIVAVYLGSANLADNAKGRFRVSGRVRALVQKDSGNIVKMDPLTPSASGYLDADTSAGNIYSALALEAATGPSTATLIDVLLSGVSPFGTEPA